jgi:hypothetical protein
MLKNSTLKKYNIIVLGIILVLGVLIYNAHKTEIKQIAKNSEVIQTLFHWSHIEELNIN